MKHFIIYGAASIGNLAKNALEKCNAKIIGYIDKRAFELESFNQLPVWEIDNVPEKYISQQIIVFVGVKNVFEHEKIVRILNKKGFKYIVYKPYSVLIGKGNTEEESISEIYDMLFQGMLDVAEMKLPICKVNRPKSTFDYAVLKESYADIIAYVPAEFIYTNNYIEGGMVKWGNINILSYFTHIDFFRFLDNREDASIDSYIKEYCEYTAGLQKNCVVTDSWKENVIKNRIQIYEEMCECLNLDFDFFIRNAPEAIWNDEKHIFNLTNGKHRSTFLASKGIKYIPLKVKKTDYDKFYHKEEISKVNEQLSLIESDIMIPHPCFYRHDRNADKGEYVFLSWFARYYGKKSFYKYGKVMFEQMKIIDWSNDFGYCARFLSRLGCKVQRFVYPTELERQLNQLFYSSCSYKSENYNDAEENYDIGIINQSQVGSFLPYCAQCENIIVKDCSQQNIENICNSLKLEILLKITDRYLGLKLKGTYLLKHTEW